MIAMCIGTCSLLVAVQNKFLAVFPLNLFQRLFYLHNIFIFFVNIQLAFIKIIHNVHEKNRFVGHPRWDLLRVKSIVSFELWLNNAIDLQIVSVRFFFFAMTAAWMFMRCKRWKVKNWICNTFLQIIYRF